MKPRERYRLPGTVGGGFCMARRGAISSAALRPSCGRRRLQWQWGANWARSRRERRVASRPGERARALPRGGREEGREGRGGGRTRRRDNTRRRPHKGRGRGEMEMERRGAVTVWWGCVTAPPSLLCSGLWTPQLAVLFSSRRAISDGFICDFLSGFLARMALGTGF